MLAIVSSCADVPEAIPAAMSARATIEKQGREDYQTVAESLLVALDDAWWQYAEAEHEAKLREKAAAGALTVEGVLQLRQDYADVHAAAQAKLKAFREQLAAVETYLRSADALDERTRRTLDKMRDRANAFEGLSSAALEAAKTAAAAQKARKAAKAEKKRREAAEAAEREASEGD